MSRREGVQAEEVGPVFRFDAEDHRYFLDGVEIPHITGMLGRTGWIDDTWFTEESSDRGTCVHQLTAAYDNGALDAQACTSLFKGYLLGHVHCMNVIRPEWHAVEVASVHPIYKFGGRPDRAGVAYGCLSVLEVKSGGPARSHAIQTALQAILRSGLGGLPAEHYERLAEYLRPNGKYHVERFHDRRDFDEAWRIIRVCC